MFRFQPFIRRFIILLSFPLLITVPGVPSEAGVVELGSRDSYCGGGTCSLRDFTSLSQDQVNTLAQTSGVRIEGFSSSMSRLLIRMAAAQRSGTQKLVRDMSKLTATSARSARLRKEIQKVEKRRASIRAKLARGGGSFVTRQRKVELAKLDTYLKGLRTWARSPRAGMA